MKIIVFSFILSVVSLTCTDTDRPVVKGAVTDKSKVIEVLKSETELNPNKGLVYHKDQPFTGRVISHHPNDIVGEAVDYVSGMRHGYHRKWFANGELAFESRWDDGLLDGVSKSWWSNGNQRSEANQVSGKLHGVQLQWYQSGAKFKERNMNMGIEEGMQKSWRENGKVYNNYEARNGRIFGLKRASLCFQLDDEEIQISQ